MGSREEDKEKKKNFKGSNGNLEDCRRSPP